MSRKECGVPELEGDLARTPLIHVLEAFAAHGASGMLRVDGPHGEHVLFWLRNGEVVLGARIDANGIPRPDLAHRLVTAGIVDVEQVRSAHRSVAATGVTIIEALLASGRLRQRQLGPHRMEVVIDAFTVAASWPHGTWRLHPASRVPHLPGLAFSTVKAAALSRADDVGTAESLAVALAAVPALTGSRDYQAFDLAPEAWAVLSAVDGDRTTAAIGAACGLTDAEAVQVVAALTEAALLAPDVRGGPTPITPPPAARPESVATVGDLQVITASPDEPTPAEDPTPAPVAAAPASAVAEAEAVLAQEPVPSKTDTAALMRELSGLGFATEPTETPGTPPARSHRPNSGDHERKRNWFGR